MHLGRLITREIRHRWGRFALGVLSVTVAVAGGVGAVSLLRAHEDRARAILERKEADLQRQVAALNDQIRKTMLHLGFNVVILPRDQNLSDLYADDFAAKDMPEEYVTRLTQARVMTIQHLLPSLQQKIEWPEYKRTILLVGTRGEAPLTESDAKKPLVQPVPPNAIVLGHELHRGLSVTTGDVVRLMGRPFTVHQCYAARGNKDDITAWIPLAEAQALLGKPGRINAILALECQCGLDALAQVRAEIARVLPETQVIERASEALARAEARRKVEADGVTALEEERRTSRQLQQERERLAAWLVPLVGLACALWIGLLAWGDVRERRFEIGLLRALGVGGGRILGLFLSKLAAMGVAGGALGVVLGWAVGARVGAIVEPGVAAALSRPDAALLGLAFCLAPVLSLLAGWLPAVWAARQDPADILREA